jgi:hypothetical protein
MQAIVGGRIQCVCPVTPRDAWSGFPQQVGLRFEWQTGDAQKASNLICSKFLQADNPLSIHARAECPRHTVQFGEESCQLSKTRFGIRTP